MGQSNARAAALGSGKEKKIKAGAPTIYTEELADKVCELIATHTVGYQKILQMYPDIGLPHEKAMYLWKYRHPTFAQKYLDAKRAQAELMVQEIDEMLPSEINSYVDDKGNVKIDPPSAMLAVARANNRKWTASRLAPKVYGDRKEVEEKIEENLELKKELAELRAKLDAQNKKDF